MRTTLTFCFYIYFPTPEYRTVGNIFKPSNKLTDKEWENSEHLQIFYDELISDMIFEQTHYSESCQIQEGLKISFDAEDIKIPINKIKKFLRAVEKWAITTPTIKATQTPYIYNKSGNPNYNDPEWRTGKGIFPENITNLLY